MEDKVVFTNGCFDLLHPGHLSLLEFCSRMGRVVVGLNSDRSVRALKGDLRPIIGEAQRKYSLESCKWVSEVHIFDEDTPLELIRKLRPDVIVKGAEYRGQSVIGEGLAEVVLFEPIMQFSTSQIIDRIRAHVN
jgi:D-beta-D-heptose 7-phosphate kinase / D-beta-D-heptose 1-phosphate adenosyltransferase